MSIQWSITGSKSYVFARIRAFGWILINHHHHQAHIETVCSKARRRLFMLTKASWYFRSSVVVGFYQGFIRTMMEYGSFIYGARASRSLLGKLDGIQKKALLKCLHVGVSIPLEVLEIEAQVEPLSIRRLVQAKSNLDRAIAQPLSLIHI